MRLTVGEDPGIDHPDEGQLLAAIADVQREEGYAVIVDLSEDAGDTFFQFNYISGFGFGVEYRDGGPDHHFAATTTDPAVVLQAASGWLARTSNWTDCLNWNRYLGDPRLEESESRRRVQEYRRKCQMCGKVWHSLVQREAQIHSSQKAHACAAIGNCCGPSGAQLQASRNLDANTSELTRLRQCPSCGSANYTEILVGG